MMMMMLDNNNTLNNNPKVIRINLLAIKIVIDLSEKTRKNLTWERNSRIVISIDKRQEQKQTFYIKNL